MSIPDKDFTELLREVTDISARLKINEETVKNHGEEIKDMKEGQSGIFEIINTIKLMANSMNGMEKELSNVQTGQVELVQQLNEINNRPANEAKNFLDTAKGKLISIVVAGLICYILGTMFPMIPWR